MFSTTPVFHKNLTSTAKIKINQGGTASSKTYSLVQLLFYKAITEPKQVITITGESIPNLKKGAYRDAETIYSNTPYLQQAVRNWNKSDRIIYFHNGSIVEFVSNLDDQSAKNGKRDYLFVNEANGIGWLVFFQLGIRTRKSIYIDYNPSAPFWVHEKLIGTTPESNDLTATVEMIRSWHEHNVFLSEEEHQKIEGIKDPELWRVYARGLTGNLQGLIYVNWKQIPDSDWPDEDGLFGGVDFGYTNDPTAAVACLRIANNIYVKELCYQSAMTPNQIKSLFSSCGFTENTPIYCEHDGDMIRQLRQLELLAVAARKGAGSINAGITKVKEYNILFTASSKNIEFERSKYMWLIDKDTGKPINTPVETNNHLMDAIRYAIYTNFYRQE